MKTRTTTQKKSNAAAGAGMFKKSLGAVPHALLACSLLSACFQDPSSESGGTSGSALIEGRVMGEAGLAKRGAAMGLEGAAVTVVRLGADGSFETVSEGAVATDAEGRFSVGTSVEAAHGLMVVARKEAREFKAVVSGEVRKGSRTPCRPLDLESTLEAEVWARLHADGQGGKVSFADVASHVDASLAAKVQAADTGSEVKAYLASQLATGAGMRGKVLAASGQATHALIEKMDEALIKAQASLEIALHEAAQAEAGVTAEVRAEIERDNVKAQWSAVSGAGIALGEFALAHEAAFRAMVKSQAPASLESGTRLLWLRRIALQNAWSLEAALSEDVQAAGGDAGLVAEAGAALKVSLQAAATEAEIDSAFARCRRSASVAIKSALEGTLGAGLGLSDSSRARSAFELSLKSAATAEAVADAYARFFADAEAEIKAVLAGSLDSARLQAATRAALLIDLQGAATAKPAGGFNLSGSVAGALSGAKVELALVKADGSIEVISGAQGVTGGDGTFSINTGTSIPDKAVVVVTKDTARLVALVDAGTDSVKVGAETTVEAEQKLSLLAAVDASAKTQAKFLADSGLGLAQASLLLITTARATAQGRLETEIKAAAGESTRIRAAYDAYHGTLMEAYVKAGLDASAYARSMQVYAQAMVKASAGLSSEARMAAVRSAHSQAARGLRAAMEIQMNAAGASEAVLGAAVDAGIALQAAVDVSSQIETLSAAYASYHASITAALRGVFLLHAAAISSVDGRIRSEGGARADLMAAIKSEGATDGISKAHADFASEVEAEVDAAFKAGLGGPTAGQTRIIGQVLVLANMCG